VPALANFTGATSVRILATRFARLEGRRNIHPVKKAARSSCAGFNRARTFIQFSPADSGRRKSCHGLTAIQVLAEGRYFSAIKVDG